MPSPPHRRPIVPVPSERAWATTLAPMVLGLQHVVEREGDGLGGPRLDADSGEELMHIQPAVAVALGTHLPESPGTLYISTRRVVWLSDADTRKGYAVDFLSIALHAVSRDPEAYPSPCIYAQIETEADQDEESEGSDLEGGGILELQKITEMRLLPSDPNQLDTLFDIFCQCAELNPEPNADEEEGNSWFFGGEEMVVDGDNFEYQFSENLANPIGYANGDHDLDHSVLKLQINDQRFDDAAETEHKPQDGHH